MKKPIPYEGKDNYLFISYCHKNDERVYSLIEELANRGFRIWYDTGIEPGDEWPEVIATHLSECSACIAFMSEASMSSHNCRREINYAIVKQKPLIVVFIENAKLTYAMEMQLSTTQAIKAYDSTDSEVINQLVDLSLIKTCKDTNLITDVKPDKEGSDKQDGINGDLIEEPPPTLPTEIKLHNEDFTVICRLTREKTGKFVYVDGEKTALTRHNPPELELNDNKAVGRNHAWIYIENGNVFISENNAINGTYVNGKQIKQNEKVQITTNDVVTLGDEAIRITLFREIK